MVAERSLSVSYAIVVTHDVIVITIAYNRCG